MNKLLHVVFFVGLFGLIQAANQPLPAVSAVPDVLMLPKAPVVNMPFVQPTPPVHLKTNDKLPAKKMSDHMAKPAQVSEMVVEMQQPAAPKGEQEIKEQLSKEIKIATPEDNDEKIDKLISELAEYAMKKVNQKAQKHLEESIKKAIDKAIDQLVAKAAA